MLKHYPGTVDMVLVSDASPETFKADWGAYDPEAFPKKTCRPNTPKSARKTGVKKRQRNRV